MIGSVMAYVVQPTDHSPVDSRLRGNDGLGAGMMGQGQYE